MTLQSSGVISLSDIQTEFGGANPIALSEYYRGGAYVPNHPNNTNIPTSGVISISNFYNTSYVYIVTYTITGSLQNFRLYDYINPASFSGPGLITLVINAGVEVTSSSTSLPALDIGSTWNSGTTINIHNYGTIVGKGGAGGEGGGGNGSTITLGSDGASGGPALQIPNPASTTVNLYNYSQGIIGGGGGGGSGGGCSWGSGITIHTPGGGGGGGAGYGAGGPGGTSTGYWGTFTIGSGAAGTLTTGGAGSLGYYQPSFNVIGGYGGSGGGLGQNGSAGVAACGFPYAATAAGYAGAGGYSIVGYPWLSSVVNSGTIAGSTTSYPASLPGAIVTSQNLPGAFNYPGCTALSYTDIQYWNGSANPYYTPPGGGDGGDGGGG